MIHIIGGLLIGLWLWWHMSDHTRDFRNPTVEDEWVVDILDEEIEDEAE